MSALVVLELEDTLGQRRPVSANAEHLHDSRKFNANWPLTPGIPFEKMNRPLLPQHRGVHLAALWMSVGLTPIVQRVAHFARPRSNGDRHSRRAALTRWNNETSWHARGHLAGIAQSTKRKRRRMWPTVGGRANWSPETSAGELQCDRAVDAIRCSSASDIRCATRYVDC